MLTNARSGQLWIIALASTLAASAWASGEGVPVPVKPGQFYVGGAYGMTRLNGPTWSSQILYKDNSAFTSDGLITITNPQGYLIENRFENERWIPQGYFGYAFGESKFGGTFRVEASAYYYDRKAGASIAGPLAAPTSGFFVEDNVFISII